MQPFNITLVNTLTATVSHCLTREGGGVGLHQIHHIQVWTNNILFTHHSITSQTTKAYSPSDHLSSSAYSDGAVSVDHHIFQGHFHPQGKEGRKGSKAGSRANRESRESERSRENITTTNAFDSFTPHVALYS